MKLREFIFKLSNIGANGDTDVTVAGNKQFNIEVVSGQGVVITPEEDNTLEKFQEFAAEKYSKPVQKGFREGNSK